LLASTGKVWESGHRAKCEVGRQVHWSTAAIHCSLGEYSDFKEERMRCGKWNQWRLKIVAV